MSSLPKPERMFIVLQEGTGSRGNPLSVDIGAKFGALVLDPDLGSSVHRRLSTDLGSNHTNTGKSLTPLPGFAADTVMVMCFLETDFSSGPKPTSTLLATDTHHRGRILTASSAVGVFGPPVKILLAWTQPRSFIYKAPSQSNLVGFERQ